MNGMIEYGQIFRMRCNSYWWYRRFGNGWFWNFTGGNGPIHLGRIGDLAVLVWQHYATHISRNYFGVFIDEPDGRLKNDNSFLCKCIHNCGLKFKRQIRTAYQRSVEETAADGFIVYVKRLTESGDKGNDLVVISSLVKQVKHFLYQLMTRTTN